MLIPAATTDGLANYDRLRDLYNDLLSQWAREVGHVAVVVGGQQQETEYAGQEGRVFQPVPRDRQQAAVQFLIDNAFTTPTYLLDPELLRRIEPTGAVDRVRTRQAAVLDILLQDARLNRLVDQSALAPDGEPAYTLEELLGDLSEGIFAELGDRRPVTDEYRRELQRTFIDQMRRLMTPERPRPADARALARATLVSLDERLEDAVDAADGVTRAHFEDLRAVIGEVLDPG
jgi:hypothetical protein